MNKSLLCEWIPFTVNKETLRESVEDGKSLIVKGILQRAEAKNQNGRVYPREILEREVARYTSQFVKERRALGELDHPDSPVVNLANVSHNILEIRWDGDDVIGSIEVFDTPAGRILKELFKKGITVGISSRGLGSVRELEEGVLQVEDDFELIAWDFVSNPSTQQAFMYPKAKQMAESVSHQPAVNKYEQVNTVLSDIFCNLGGLCKIEKYAKQ